MRNRREIWRDFMGRFEPSADPRDAVERGFYVPRPGRSLAEQLASRFELKPSASHLLVGGVGSGKTTQLLVTRERLEAAGDICAAYVDVSLAANLEEITNTDILAIVGLELAHRLAEHETTPELQSTLEAFESFLDGNRRWTRPRKFADEIHDILQRLASRYPHTVLLLDALDRLSDLERFQEIVEGAVSILRSVNIGVILVGPLTSLYGLERVTVDRFDRVWHLPAVDVASDAEGRDFLLRVLRARDTEGLLTDAAAERLPALSGGVLRDLIAMTQAAGEEAYVDGAERVEVEHVDIAADYLGRKHLVGLDSQQLAVLQRVRTQGTFVQTSEKDLALLATRRVLEYSDGTPRFAVHPTIEPLLAQIPQVP